MAKALPKLLFFDIETSYILFRGWRTGKQWVDQSQIVKGFEQNVICIAFKWLGDSTIHTLEWDLKTKNSTKMIDVFGRIVENADIALGYNSDSFDIRHINTQRLLHGQNPIAWPTNEDLFKQIKKQFYLPSYRLDYVSKLLTGTGKKPMAFDDWIEIVENKSVKHLKKMVSYCKRDVLKLEEVYKKVAPHLKPRASRSLILENSKDGCPSCGSQEHQSKGPAWRMATRVQRRICLSCGHNFTVKAA